MERKATRYSLIVFDRGRLTFGGVYDTRADAVAFAYEHGFETEQTDRLRHPHGTFRVEEIEA